MKTSHRQQVIKHLVQHGSITPKTALEKFGCFRLASVIHRLRLSGFKITTTLEPSPCGGEFARYAIQNKGTKEFTNLLKKELNHGEARNN